MIEDLITQLLQSNTELIESNATLTAALEENTAALRVGQPTVKPLLKDKPKASRKTTVVETEPTEPPATETTKSPATEPEPTDIPETTIPTKVSVQPVTPTTPSNDTPNVPSRIPVEDGQPLAAEHVDVDEVISNINSIVKAKLIASEDVDAMKRKWEVIRKGYGVDRISDLKGNPAALLDALNKAKAL